MADEGDETRLQTLIDTDDEYPMLCGVIGLGRLLADPRTERQLRGHTADVSWIARENEKKVRLAKLL